MHRFLLDTVSRAHAELDLQLRAAATAMNEGGGRGEVVERADAFLIDACKHIGAFCDVILPAAQTHLPDGRARVTAYVHQCRRLERAIAQTKRRLYGEAQTAGLSWPTIWAHLQQEFELTRQLESLLAADLGHHFTTLSDQSLANQVHEAEDSAPTRPHPNLPHVGHLAHVVRHIWARADKVWDAAESRVTPRRIAP